MLCPHDAKIITTYQDWPEPVRDMRIRYEGIARAGENRILDRHVLFLSGIVWEYTEIEGVCYAWLSLEPAWR